MCTRHNQIKKKNRRSGNEPLPRKSVRYKLAYVYGAPPKTDDRVNRYWRESRTHEGVIRWSGKGFTGRNEISGNRRHGVFYCFRTNRPERFTHSTHLLLNSTETLPGWLAPLRVVIYVPIYIYILNVHNTIHLYTRVRWYWRCPSSARVTRSTPWKTVKIILHITYSLDPTDRSTVLRPTTSRFVFLLENSLFISISGSEVRSGRYARAPKRSSPYF